MMLGEIIKDVGGDLIRLSAFIIFIVQLFITITVHIQKRRIGIKLFHVLSLVLFFTVFLFVFFGKYALDASDMYRSGVFVFISDTLLGIPWVVYVIIELIYAVMTAINLKNLIDYRKNNLSPDSIKDAVDLLPTGICVSESNTIILANMQMNKYSVGMTGKELSDAETLWSKVNPDRTINLDTGEIILFDKSEFELDGRALTLTTAVDITEQYRATEQFKENNRRLRDIQKRMREYSEKEKELLINEEVLRARTVVHSSLGGVLLTGSYYFEHPESSDRATLINMLRQANEYLLIDTDNSPQLNSALLYAESLGVEVNIAGNISERISPLLAKIVDECTANTLKHAKGDRLDIIIDNQNDCHIITVTNNGQPPSGEIKPSGGLALLKKEVKKLGGNAEIISAPEFKLIITMP